MTTLSSSRECSAAAERHTSLIQTDLGLRSRLKIKGETLDYELAA